MRFDLKIVFKMALVCCLVAVFYFAYHCGVIDNLNLSQAKNYLLVLTKYNNSNPIHFALIFFASYFVITAISLPGATILTLLAGAIFGFWQGVILVSFASTLGASFSCLIARFLLQDWLSKRFSAQVTLINQKLAKQGSYYIFVLRVLPIFPFFLVNWLIGVSRVPLTTFFIVSPLGMLPATSVYVNAGLHLGKISSWPEVFSLRILAALFLLAIMPLGAKVIITWVNRWRM